MLIIMIIMDSEVRAPNKIILTHPLSLGNEFLEAVSIQVIG